MGLIITFLVAVAAILCLLNPVAGLCAYLATIIIRPNEWLEDVKLPAIPIMLVMMSLAYMLHMGSIGPRPEGKPLRSAPLMVAMLALLVMHFIVFPSGVPLKDWILSEAAPTILLMVYMTRHASTPPRLQAVLTTISACSAILGLNSGFVHFFRKGPEEWARDREGYFYMGHGRPWNDYHLSGGRLMGHNRSIWTNPNDFGMLVNWGILGILFYIKRQGSKLVKLLCATVACALAVVLFLTGSRGGQLQLGINLWMVFVGGKRKALGLVLLAVALVGALVVLPRFSPERSDSGASKDERTELLMAGFRLFKSYPIYGAGFLRFPGYNDFKGLFPHNVYVQALAETGLIGIAIFLPMIVFLRRETSTAVKYFLAAGSINTGILAQCIGALQLSYTVFILFSNQFMRYTFAMVMTLAMGLYQAMLKDRMHRAADAEESPAVEPAPSPAPVGSQDLSSVVVEELPESAPPTTVGSGEGQKVRYVFDPRRKDGQIEARVHPGPRRLSSGSVGGDELDERDDEDGPPGTGGRG